MAKGILQTVDRSLQVLEIISEHPSGLTTKQIEEVIGLNKVTVHRLLATLENRGFVERIGNTYIIGLKMVELSSMKLNNIELKTEAAPYLRELVNNFKRPVQLAILEDKEAIFIEKMESVNTLRMYSQIGRRIPLYCAAVGKALLFQEKDEVILEKLGSVKFQKFTPTTLENANEVLEEIKEGRKRGYAIDNEEHERGIFCIAVPIYDYRGKIIAGLSVAAQEEQFIKMPSESDIAQIKYIGKEISKRLGYNGL
jgi:DNA-binding IclR family transcriptional regulator